MSSNKPMILGIVLALLVLIGSKSVYIVKETERAVKLQFGEIVDNDVPPGLHFMIPMVNKIRKFDSRVLTLDGRPQAFLTNEKKRLIVDAFIMWRIVDVQKYYTATSGDEFRAADLIGVRVENQLRNQFGTRTLKQVVSGQREELMARVKLWLNNPEEAARLRRAELAEAAKADGREVAVEQVDDKDAGDKKVGIAQSLGVEIIDVRIKQVELPAEVSNSVYERMRTEREREARELRSNGKEQAEGIRAAADRERTILLAEAYRKSEEIRGEGDAKAASIYAESYGQDSEFYTFTRSLKAYRESFNGNGDVMLLKPDSEFFRYLNNGSTAP